MGSNPTPSAISQALFADFQSKLARSFSSNGRVKLPNARRTPCKRMARESGTPEKPQNGSPVSLDCEMHSVRPRCRATLAA